MRKFARLLALALAGRSPATDSSATDVSAKRDGVDPIDYDRAIHLDAEALAETGMGDAYRELQRESGDLGVHWAPMREIVDEGGANYRVEVKGKVYPVFGSPPTDDPWAVATATFFDVVNGQLAEFPFKFYAINAGNDLHAVPLTPDEFAKAQQHHRGSPYGPYVPNYAPPDYGLPQ